MIRSGWQVFLVGRSVFSQLEPSPHQVGVSSFDKILVIVHNTTKPKLGNMPRKKRNLILTQQVKEGLKSIKVQLDSRTTVTLASLKALEFWKQKYPNAKVIS